MVFCLLRNSLKIIYQLIQFIKKFNFTVSQEYTIVGYSLQVFFFLRLQNSVDSDKPTFKKSF